MKISHFSHHEPKYYKRRKVEPVTAIQLNFETDKDTKTLFNYNKWGDKQSCKPGDWLVKSGDEVYTIDKDSFANTYKKEDGDRYYKAVGVYAVKAQEDGVISTKEGKTHYKRGDFIVYNDKGLTDGYAIDGEKFNSLYVVA